MCQAGGVSSAARHPHCTKNPSNHAIFEGSGMTVLDAMLLLNAAVGLLGALYVLWPWEAV